MWMQGASAYFSAQVEGLDLVLLHQHYAQIVAWRGYLKRRVWLKLLPNEYILPHHTQVTSVDTS